ncbi:hypothetical protein Bca4012_026429 [Brassica carinata]
MLVPGPTIRSDPCSSWFLLIPGPILRTDPCSVRFLPVPGPNPKPMFIIIDLAGSGSSLHIKPHQPSNPIWAVISSTQRIGQEESEEELLEILQAYQTTIKK